MYFRERGSGPPTILFLHGNLSSSLWWDKVLALLPPGWRAIAPDFHGYGRSTAPPEKYGIEEMAADVAALRQRLNLSSFVLVGHSMGGAVALQYALQNPENIQALLLVDPVPASGLHLPNEVFELLETMKSDFSSMKEGLRGTAPGAPDDAFFHSLVQGALESTPQAFREIPKSMAEFDVSARLNEIACPTLCVMGENDLLISKKDIERMCEVISNCAFVEMPGVGHCPSIEAPEELTRLLVSFLAEAIPQRVS
jgi:branched-chain amino acid transport system permease protein